MFARVVECHSKVGRSGQVGNKLSNSVLPILQQQVAFADFLMLADKTDPERLLCISLWISQENADEYDSQHYYAITRILKPLLESPPTLETFEVNASIGHRIAVGRAA
jgi:quinol monooxygenase YgiN